MRDSQKEKRTLGDAFPMDPRLVKLIGLISEVLERDCKGKEFCDVELIHRFRDEFKVSEEDVTIALSDLISHGKLIVLSVCFLRVNRVRVPA